MPSDPRGALASTAADPGEIALFVRRVTDLVKGPAVACTAGATVAEAARLMTRRSVGSVIVVDGDGAATGILTDRDLRTRVVATGLSPSTAVGQTWQGRPNPPQGSVQSIAWLQRGCRGPLPDRAGRLMRLERKLTLAVLGLFIPPTVVAGFVLLLVYRRGLLEESRQAARRRAHRPRRMVAYLIVVARGIGHSLVRTIEELRRGAELIATVNPAHRLNVRTGDELEALGEEINRLADRLRVARDGLRDDDFSLLETVERHVGPAEREHRLDALTFVVFDTETTGLRPEAGDRVVSLAGVRVRGGIVRRHETFDTLVDPGREVPEESVRIHGITAEMLVGAPRLETALPAFLEFAGPAVLVGHEASFDLRFLEPEARRLGLPSLAESRPVLDTRLLSRSLHGPGESHTLDAVAQRLGVMIAGRHSALGDAVITAEVLVRLLTLIQKRGILTLGQALDAVRRARRVTI